MNSLSDWFIISLILECDSCKYLVGSSLLKTTGLLADSKRFQDLLVDFSNFWVAFFHV